MIDLVVGLGVIVVLFAASRYTWKQMKAGGCAGCSQCPSQGSASCHCQEAPEEESV